MQQLKYALAGLLFLSPAIALADDAPATTEGLHGGRTRPKRGRWCVGVCGSEHDGRRSDGDRRRDGGG